MPVTLERCPAPGLVADLPRRTDSKMREASSSLKRRLYRLQLRWLFAEEAADVNGLQLSVTRFLKDGRREPCSIYAVEPVSWLEIASLVRFC